ncbi:MAG: MoxR family ATPase [Oscillospiraceae bacterium]|nr:MoxR family ATPase [Oscillospiraceae bacterium]
MVDIAENTRKINALIESVSRVIVGKDDIIKNVIAALICSGHVLIEDVPGVGKTQLVSALSRSLGGKFNRIQLTPDIMPSDIVGFSVVNQQTYELEYRQGAAMCNFLLADEINRASPKAQSSLLEIMEEGQISLDGKTHILPKPFMVLATQNPVETYGTYHLPEAQMDRFFMKISMGYPTKAQELEIIRRTEGGNPISNIESPVLELSDITGLQNDVRNINIMPNLREYIVELCSVTRTNDMVTLGISPRGSICLNKASAACAMINGRDYVTPDDIKQMARCVLPHRIILSSKGRSRYGTSNAYVEELTNSVPVPM